MFHLVVEGFFQWLIGSNLTRRCNIEYVGLTYIGLPDVFWTDLIQMWEYGHYIHIYICWFIIEEYNIGNNPQSTEALAATSVFTSVEPINWSSIRWIDDRFHAHVCILAQDSDIRPLMTRIKFGKKMYRIICWSCKASSTPPPNFLELISKRKITLIFRSITFNSDTYKYGDMASI